MVLLSSELERLALLAEECGEVIQVIGKILRHGLEASSPVPHELGQETNYELLVKEVGDLSLIIDQFMMTEMSVKAIEQRKLEKLLKINKYLNHNEFHEYFKTGECVYV